jgi:hypothetical protein
MIRRSRFVIALAAVAAVLAVPATSTAANNPAASGTLSSQADWISPAQITVYFTASCAPYFVGMTAGTGFANLVVNQVTSSTTGGSGNGFTVFPCDGQSHKIAVNVSPGPWQLGTALATWAVCGFACDSGVKQIKITRA